MTLLPPEARDGLMRAWLAILRERHPEVVWVAVPQSRQTQSFPTVVEHEFGDQTTVETDQRLAA